MKPIFLGLCLLAATSSAFAQPQTPATLANTGGVALSAQPQTVSLKQLMARAQPALLNLRAPLNGETQMMAVAWGKDGVLLSSTQNGFVLKTVARNGQRFTAARRWFPPRPLRLCASRTRCKSCRLPRWAMMRS